MIWSRRQIKTAPGCVFCAIVAGRSPAHIEERTRDALLFRPIDPVTPGHLLAIPLTHVARFHSDPRVTGRIMEQAARWAQDDEPNYNIIVNTGSHAGQTVFHLHVHLVPRWPQDGLVMPWD